MANVIDPVKLVRTKCLTAVMPVIVPELDNVIDGHELAPVAFPKTKALFPVPVQFIMVPPYELVPVVPVLRTVQIGRAHV